MFSFTHPGYRFPHLHPSLPYPSQLIKEIQGEAQQFERQKSLCLTFLSHTPHPAPWRKTLIIHPTSKMHIPPRRGLSQFAVITIGRSPASWILNKLRRRQPTAIIGNFLKHLLKGMYISVAFNDTLWLNSANKSSHSQFRICRKLRVKASSLVVLILCLAHRF